MYILIMPKTTAQSSIVEIKYPQKNTPIWHFSSKFILWDTWMNLISITSIVFVKSLKIWYFTMTSASITSPHHSPLPIPTPLHHSHHAIRYISPSLTLSHYTPSLHHSTLLSPPCVLTSPSLSGTPMHSYPHQLPFDQSPLPITYRLKVISTLQNQLPLCSIFCFFTA